MKSKKLCSLLILLCMCLPACGESPQPYETATDNLSESLILRYEILLKSQKQQIDDLLSAIESTKNGTETSDENSTSEHIQETESETSDLNRNPTETQTEHQTETDIDINSTVSTRPEDLFIWEDTGNGIRITGYNGNASKLIIPSSISGKSVTEIADNAFSGANIQEVHIENGIGSIGWFAFYGCTSLVIVYIPESVASIGYAAFDGCRSGFTIHCAENSYAQKYANSFAIPCKTGSY